MEYVYVSLREIPGIRYCGESSTCVDVRKLMLRYVLQAKITNSRKEKALVVST